MSEDKKAAATLATSMSKTVTAADIPLKGRTDFQGSSRILATETIRV